MTEKVGGIELTASIDTTGAVQAGKVLAKTADQMTADLARVAAAAEAASKAEQELAAKTEHLSRVMQQSAKNADQARAANQANTAKILEQRAAQEAARRPVEQMIAALRDQAATMGMTTKQLALYRATQAGATEADKKAITASIQQIEAFHRKADAARAANMQLTQTSVAVGQATGSLRGMRGIAQSAGYQLQDIAVQAQMGTNAMIILGQQGSQFAAAFGPIGAIVGAFIAIGAAVGTAALPALFSANDAAEKLDKTMQALAETTIETDDGVMLLTKNIEALAKVSKEAAMAEITAGLVRAKQAAEQAGKAILEAFDENVSVGGWIYDINDAIKFLNVNTPQATTFMKGLGKEFGASAEQAEDVGREISRLLKETSENRTPQAFVALQNALASISASGEIAIRKADGLGYKFETLSLAGGGASDKMKIFISDLNKFFSKAEQSAEITEFLTAAIKNLDGALADSSESSAEAIKQLNQQLQIQKTELTAGAAAAELLAFAFSMGKTSAEQLTPEIKALYDTLKSGQGELAGRELLKGLDDQLAKLTMTTDAYEEYAAVQQAEASKATPAQIAAIRSKIKALQDERKAIQDNVDLQDEIAANVKTEEEEKKKVTTEFKQVQSAVQGDLESPEQKARRELGERLKTIQEYGEQELLTQQQIDAYKIQAAEATEKQITLIRKQEEQMRQQTMQTTLGAVGDMFGNLADIAKEGGEKSFKSWKMMASAQAGISAALAIINTMASVPFPFNIAASTAIGALAAVQIAKIQGQQYSGGRLYGGPVQSGGMYRVTEDGKPEILQQGNQQYLLPGSKGGAVVSNKDMKSGDSGGLNVYVTSNVNVSQLDSSNSQQWIAQYADSISKAVDATARRYGKGVR